jgi:small-conductance mechanosensitive channel
MALCEEKPGVFTFLSAIGSASFVIFNVALALRTLSEYKRSPDHPRRAVVGGIVMLLLALLNVLSWIVVLTHPLVIKNPAALIIVLFDLTLLVYGWTTPSEKWKSRRNNWKSLLMMALLSVILVIACVLVFASSI